MWSVMAGLKFQICTNVYILWFFFLSIIYYFVFTILSSFFFVWWHDERKTSFSKMEDTIACRFLCDAVDSISLMRVRYISRNCKYLFYIDISVVKIHYNYRYMLEQYEFYSSRFQFYHFFCISNKTVFSNIFIWIILNILLHETMGMFCSQLNTWMKCKLKQYSKCFPFFIELSLLFFDGISKLVKFEA